MVRTVAGLWRGTIVAPATDRNAQTCRTARIPAALGATTQWPGVADGVIPSRPVPVSRAAWWLWPHLLSLDAPLVAVVWQRWWAHSAGFRPRWGDGLILGLGVWMIYLGDRLADTASPAAGGHESPRHAFYRRRHRTVQPIVATVFIALAWLAPALLPVHQFLMGLGLLLLTGAYFWLVHRRVGRDWAHLLPKEAAVGFLFAAGTGFFVVVGGRPIPTELLAALPLFGGLCFLNCALITKWERSPRDARESSSLLNAFPRFVAGLNVACLLLAALTSAAAVIFPHGMIFTPMLVSALLLAALDRGRDHLSIDALRVLADAVLLTPWFVLQGLPHGS